MASADLMAANPWPDDPPAAPVVQWGWGIEGTDLLRAAVSPEASVVVEIGSLLGGSARFWAEHCPQAHVVCIDPWIDVRAASDRPFLEHVPELVDWVVGREDGLFDVFLASNWGLRDRLTPIRGFSPDALTEVVRHGVEPDVVYVDGSHVYEDVVADLSVARSFFPTALVCGDDYTWPSVRDAVGYVAAVRGDEVRAAGNTFVIETTGDGTRHPAPSARPMDRGERSLPVRLARAVVGELRRRRLTARSER